MLGVERVPQSEIDPLGLPEILKRFGLKSPEQIRLEELEARLDHPQTFAEGIVSAAIRKRVEFRPKVIWESCPQAVLVLAGVHFVGRTSPEYLQLVRNFYCGHKRERINSLGRSGTESIPYSRCWQIAMELTALTKFMEKTNDPLADQNKITDVYATWLETYEEFERRGIVGILRRKNQKLLTGEVGITEATTVQTAVAGYQFNAKRQLDIGGEEYLELLSFVQGYVLKPLVDIVGEGNLDPGTPGFNLSDFKRSATKCPESPERKFIGLRF